MKKYEKIMQWSCRPSRHGPSFLQFPTAFNAPKASLRSWPDTQLRPIFVGTKTGSSKHLISY